MPRLSIQQMVTYLPLAGELWVINRQTLRTTQSGLWYLLRTFVSEPHSDDPVAQETSSQAKPQHPTLSSRCFQHRGGFLMVVVLLLVTMAQQHRHWGRNSGLSFEMQIPWMLSNCGNSTIFRNLASTQDNELVHSLLVRTEAVPGYTLYGSGVVQLLVTR